MRRSPAIAFALAFACNHPAHDVRDAATPSDGGDASAPAATVVDAAADAVVIDAARLVRQRSLGRFPRDVEEPDFREYVEIPVGTLALSFTLSEALDCHDVTLLVDTHGPHAPLSVVLERRSGNGATTEIARETATCDRARYCSKKISRSSLTRGAYVVELTNDDAPITARVTIDTCHGAE